MRFENREHLRNKIDWEGGIYDALEYGIKVEDMPEDDDELEMAWSHLRDAFLTTQLAADRVMELLECDLTDTDGDRDIR